MSLFKVAIIGALVLVVFVFGFELWRRRSTGDKAGQEPHVFLISFLKRFVGRQDEVFSPTLSIGIVVIAGLSLWLWVPERPVEVHLHIDLRAALLLFAGGVILMQARESRQGERQAVEAPAVGLPRKDVKEAQVQAELPAPDFRSIPEEIVQEVAFWRANPAEAEKQRQRNIDASAIERLYADMMGTSPNLLHRFPAHCFETGGETNWSSPVFSASGLLWSVRMGPVTAGPGASSARYFCLLPHGHSERLKCSFLFARRLGEISRYREKRVHDWPEQLAGHPWGPTISSDEIGDYLQVDGSLLLMIHSVGLGGGD